VEGPLGGGESSTNIKWYIKEDALLKDSKRLGILFSWGHRCADQERGNRCSAGGNRCILSAWGKNILKGKKGVGGGHKHKKACGEKPLIGVGLLYMTGGGGREEP